MNFTSKTKRVGGASQVKQKELNVSSLIKFLYNYETDKNGHSL